MHTCTHSLTPRYARPIGGGGQGAGQIREAGAGLPELAGWGRAVAKMMENAARRLGLVIAARAGRGTRPHNRWRYSRALVRRKAGPASAELAGGVDKERDALDRKILWGNNPLAM